MAQVLPLPLVPATCTARRRSCGWPSSASAACIRSRPSTTVDGERLWRKAKASAGVDTTSAVPGASAHQREQASETGAQLPARDDGVHHAVLEQELAALK